MSLPPDPNRLEAAYRTARAALLAERTPEGHWVGELSTSALSTATAVSALALVQRHTQTDAHDRLIAGGMAWLVAHQNADGGWGATTRSLSNISTTMLVRAAFHLTGTAGQHADSLRRTEAYLETHSGKTPAEQAEAIRARYGKDRTFAVPILTTCALAGLVSWREVQPLPFELACFPQSWFRFLRLHVVSYALPALIAIGQVVHHHRPSWNPFVRLVRWLTRGKSLRVLRAIQPSSGGYLEATPLTSFVTLSLTGAGLAEHPVVLDALEFLVRSVRPDGSWPIDSNLATWVTTLSINALAVAGDERHYPSGGCGQDWLRDCQFRDRHPYTGSEPGGWGWTDLPGSVPDVDDTAGALLAFSHYFSPHDMWPAMIIQGIAWLLRLQNNDGGWPTFCRGWGALPFDRSGNDLTAHALRALSAWAGGLTPNRSPVKCTVEAAGRVLHSVAFSREDVLRAISNGLGFLSQSQRPDGSWLPLWFGNQHAPNDENPTYGTARVLAAYRDLDKMDSDPARRGVAWLLSAQNADGGWGGAAGVPSSIEETALAVVVLLDAGPTAEPAVNKGLAWLVEQVEAGGLHNPTPIGFYFAKLWYFEKLYPLIFTVAALGRARRTLSHRPAGEADSSARRDCTPF
jgi:squalene-hopene/tetraprenyl-beta-curcumene cyclase